MFALGTQSARPVNAGPPKSSSNPELHGFGEFSRFPILQLDLANRFPKLMIIALDLKGALLHELEDFVRN